MIDIKTIMDYIAILLETTKDMQERLMKTLYSSTLIKRSPSAKWIMAV